MQLITQELRPQSIQYYEIEVPLEKVQQALNRAFRKVAAGISLPGFRKGKVPRSMIERRFGVEILYEDAINYLLGEAYTWITEELKPEALDRPTADVTRFNHEETAILTFEVPIKPGVVLGEYKGIRAAKPEQVIGEAEIDAEVERLQQEHARLVSIATGLAEEQDTITLDYEGFIDGEAFEGGKGEDYSLVLGSGHFIPGFEEKLIGSEIGVELEIAVTFPEDYRAENLAGKDATFICSIKEAKRKELLPIDDEFAQEVSEYDTLQEWKEHLQTELQERADKEAEDSFQNAVLAKVTATTVIDLPEVLIERDIDQRIQSFSYSLMRQGFRLEDYLQMIGKSMDDMRLDFHPLADVAVRQMLSLEAIAKAEELEPNEEDIETYFKDLATATGTEDHLELQNSFREDEARYQDCLEEIRYRKAIDLVVAAAIPISVEEAAAEEAAAAAEAIAKEALRLAEEAEHAAAEATETVDAAPAEEAVTSEEAVESGTSPVQPDQAAEGVSAEEEVPAPAEQPKKRTRRKAKAKTEDPESEASAPEPPPESEANYA